LLEDARTNGEEGRSQAEMDFKPQKLRKHVFGNAE